MFRFPFPLSTRLLSLAFLGSLGHARAADVLDQLTPERQEDRQQVRPKAKVQDEDQDGAKSGETDADAGETLLESLTGVILCPESRLAEIQASAAGVKGISVSGFSPEGAAAFAKMASPLLGKAVGLADLKKLETKTEGWLQAHGSTLADVFLPPQEITGGVVIYALRNRVLGDVRVKGKVLFGLPKLKKALRATPGKAVSGRQMTEDLQWLNENPFRRVDLVYVDGKSPQQADVELRVTERRPWRVFTGMNNFSSERLGDNRWFLGVQAGNLWHREHELTAQLLQSMDQDKLQALAGSYRLPLDWPRRQILELSGVTSTSDVSLPNDLDLSGKIWRVGASLIEPLPAWADLRHQLSLGADYQENSYSLLAGDGRSLSRESVIFSLKLGYEAHWADVLGHTAADFSLEYSPGTMGADAAEYTALRAGSKPTFWVFHGKLERSWWLPGQFTLFTKIAGQYAPEPLLSSERYTATGYNEVRGYDESDAFADRALRLTAELRSDYYRLPLPTKLGPVRAQGIAFWDAAWLENAAGAKAPGPLHGLGLGVRMAVGSNLQLRADLAWPLQDIRPTTPENSPRWHLGATLTF